MNVSIGTRLALKRMRRSSMQEEEVGAATAEELTDETE
jgi:hypothetical protein